ncbi:LOW QUALITY PROTEIN: mas-related G-protein coupled receptor member X4-like [Sorex araneus]|uniref:LOW QUALITY PROTEIN: mas-related G-protein coupled receptor member X4-like n=1 Tax=Sorex araneus TaxID=42254 RepID=UPI002433B942|nr:LOW QUALITY PROTEIN: mas-related G-protein coupled receptor member X4-like [Sorex araneus]
MEVANAPFCSTCPNSLNLVIGVICSREGILILVNPRVIGSEVDHPSKTENRADSTNYTVGFIVQELVTWRGDLRSEQRPVGLKSPAAVPHSLPGVSPLTLCNVAWPRKWGNQELGIFPICEELNTTGEYLRLDTAVTAWLSVSTPQDKPDQMDIRQIIQKALLITRILECIISLVGLAGNAVVLWLLGFRMQRNAFSVYILNLAGADFAFLFIFMTACIRSFFPGLQFKFSYKIKFLRNIFSFPYIVGLSIITAISTERCLSVLKPIWFYSHRPKYLSAVVCALLWALSLLLSTLRITFCDYPSGMYDEYLCELTDLSIAIWLVLCSVLLLVSSLVLLTRLLCGSRKLKLTRLYVTISLTVLVFLLCGLPWGIGLFLKPSRIIWNGIHGFRYSLATQVLSCVNSCANPIIYFFVGFYRKQERQQRRHLKIILQRALQDNPEDNGIEGRPQETLEMSGRNNDSYPRVML